MFSLLDFSGLVLVEFVESVELVEDLSGFLSYFIDVVLFVELVVDLSGFWSSFLVEVEVVVFEVSEVFEVFETLENISYFLISFYFFYKILRNWFKFLLPPTVALVLSN